MIDIQLPNIWLYAKGHYPKTKNIFNDLRTILDFKYNNPSDNNIIKIILNHVVELKLIEKESDYSTFILELIEDPWYSNKKQDNKTRLINNLLKIISITPVQNIYNISRKDFDKITQALIENGGS